MQAPTRRPGRPERPVDPGNDPQDAFAFALRKLREESGSPSYRAMAGRVPYAASTLARAASGDSLPHRDLALAYARACGGDQDEWQSRWDAAAAATPSARDRALPLDGGLAPGQPPPRQDEPSQPSVPSGPEKPQRRHSRPGRFAWGWHRSSWRPRPSLPSLSRARHPTARGRSRQRPRL